MFQSKHKLASCNKIIKKECKIKALYKSISQQKCRFLPVIKTENGFYYILCSIIKCYLRHFMLSFVSLYALNCLISCAHLPHFTLQILRLLSLFCRHSLNHLKHMMLQAKIECTLIRQITKDECASFMP